MHLLKCCIVHNLPWRAAIIQEILRMRKSLFLILPLAAGVDVSCAPFVVNGSPDYDTCKFTACPGQVISASLCYADSKCEGDTYLTLHNDNNTRVELNDDFCGVCSALSYSVPHSVECGVFELRQGCFSSFCSGITAVSVADRPQHGWEPWFYANPLDHRGAVLTAWFVEVAIWGFLSSVQFILHKNEYPSAVRKVGVFKAILIFSLWFLLEFSILSARFNYYLQHENGHKYEPYRLGR